VYIYNNEVGCAANGGDGVVYMYMCVYIYMYVCILIQPRFS